MEHDEFVIMLMDFIEAIAAWPICLTMFSYTLGVASLAIGGIFCITGLKKAEVTSLTLGKAFFFTGLLFGSVVIVLTILLTIFVALPISLEGCL